MFFSAQLKSFEGNHVAIYPNYIVNTFYSNFHNQTYNVPVLMAGIGAEGNLGALFREVDTETGIGARTLRV